MPWCEWRQAQEDLKHAQEAEAKEQALAVNGIQQAQEDLYGVLHRTEHPEDVSAQYRQHWRVYRQYHVTDLVADIEDAFDQCKDDLNCPLEALTGHLRLDVYLPDTHDNFNTLVDYKRIASILSMDFEVELARPMAMKLARYIAAKTGRTEFPEVEIIFNKVGMGYGA